MQTSDFSKIIDSHFHSLSVKEKGFDIEQTLSSLAGGIDIGTCCSDLKERYELVSRFPLIKMSAAMGPWETQDKTIEQLDCEFEILKENIKTFKPLFIGEAGLDYHYMYGSRETQIYLFDKHLSLSEKLGKKILIHNRESDRDTEKLIKQHTATGVIHCFSGDEDFMKNAVDCGYYISFAGNLTYKANENLREILKKVPKDRLLLETDAPYLAPSVMRGKPNTPLYIPYTYQCACEVLNLDLNCLKDIIFENFTRFCN